MEKKRRTEEKIARKRAEKEEKRARKKARRACPGTESLKAAALPVELAPDSAEEAASLERRHVREVYDGIARQWHGTRYKPWPKVEAWIAALPRGSLVADFGCGNGKNLPSCAAAGHVAIACDFSAELADIAAHSQNPNPYPNPHPNPNPDSNPNPNPNPNPPRIGAAAPWTGSGDFEGEALAVLLPVGSALRLDGAAADAFEHAIPRTREARTSFTFRRLDAEHRT
mmetsp:Transcript_27413/g.86897  ORF Transcript_27413/g.86897 Transcript_27413/m.86897 type:complete len:227 (-) Transcript_27413:31-711(-)